MRWASASKLVRLDHVPVGVHTVDEVNRVLAAPFAAIFSSIARKGAASSTREHQDGPLDGPDIEAADRPGQPDRLADHGALAQEAAHQSAGHVADQEQTLVRAASIELKEYARYCSASPGTCKLAYCPGR